MADLASGTRIGPYLIEAAIGEGGMGAVYRAQDTRLHRSVAIKFMKQEFTDRFEREARAIAALNDSRICAVYDVGQHEGASYLVMEHIEGKALGGPLPEEKAIQYGIEICRALEVAHRKGIIHRDLKPANIMITKSGIKLLDFGLAKQQAASAAGTEHTRTLAMTGENTIAGTPSYMAPEQVEGAETDARGDIFAFGCVLYEMLSGKQAFTGKSVAGVLAAVLAAEPKAVRETAPGTSPTLDSILRRCLAKDPDARWQSAADVAAALELVTEWRVAEAPVRKARLRVGVLLSAGAVVLAAVSVAGYFLLRPAPPQPVVRLELQFPAGHDLRRTGFSPIVSPDGSMIAFRSGEAGKPPAIWLRRLDSLETRQVPGTEGALSFVWSPDSLEFVFRARFELRRISVTGDASRVIAKLSQPDGGRAWLEDGRILWSERGVLQVIGADGGEMKPLTRLNATFGDRFHLQPVPMLEHDRLLYRAVGPPGSVSQLRLAKLSTGEDVAVVPIDAAPVLWDPSGYLIYPSGANLAARKFDPKSASFRGAQVSIGELPAINALTAALFSVSRTGVLAYKTAAKTADSQLGIYDRTGNLQMRLGEPADHSNPAVSPDGKRVAAGIRGPGGKRDIFIFDVQRGSRTRLTDDPSDDFNPVWSPDGLRMVFASDRKGTRDLYLKTVDSTEPERMFYEAPMEQTPERWSRDGRWILFNETVNTAPEHVLMKALPADGGKGAEPLTLTDARYREYHSDLSPDGRFLAYDSSKGGKYEVFVRNFPNTGSRWQISPNGGEEPMFSRDGRELFYVNDGAVWAVPVTAAKDRLTAGAPRQLFKIQLAPQLRNRICVMPDGRFLINAAVLTVDRAPIAVVVNWRSLLPR